MKDPIMLVNEAIKLVRKHPDADFEERTNSDLIILAEKKLDLVLPESYKIFLRELGCGDIFGFEFYGVVHEDFENSSVPDAIWLTLKMREEGANNSHVYVSDTGDGGYYVIDTSTETYSKESPVFVIEANGYVEKIAGSFGEFFHEVITSTMNDG